MYGTDCVERRKRRPFKKVATDGGLLKKIKKYFSSNTSHIYIHIYSVVVSSVSLNISHWVRGTIYRRQTIKRLLAFSLRFVRVSETAAAAAAAIIAGNLSVNGRAIYGSLAVISRRDRVTITERTCVNLQYRITLKHRLRHRVVVVAVERFGKIDKFVVRPFLSRADRFHSCAHAHVLYTRTLIARSPS